MLVSVFNSVKHGRQPTIKCGRLSLPFSLGVWAPIGQSPTVYEETRMGNMGLTLSKVPAAVVATAGKPFVADSAGECDLRRWQPDWVAISMLGCQHCNIWLENKP